MEGGAEVPTNPFTPVFGFEPHVFIGRDRLIEAVAQGLRNPPGDPNRVTVFTGPRGSGKTVLLARIAAEATAGGWVAAHAAARDGMLAELAEQAEAKGQGRLPRRPAGRISGVEAMGFGIQRETPPEAPASWRARMGALLDRLEKRGAGLMFTVDEADASVSEMVQFVQTFQIFVTEKRNVALLMAGLPAKVLQMFQHESATFLRRMFRRNLDALSLQDSEAGIKRTVELAGRGIEGGALRHAAEQAGGLPFMIQLVGYHVFNQSDRQVIDLADAKAGVMAAREDAKGMVLDASLGELSDMDMRFLRAMAEDGGAASRKADLAARLAVSPCYAGAYRRRLIAQGLVAPAGRGRVAFALPMIREWLLEDGAP
jgi:hypothetical protein